MLLMGTYEFVAAKVRIILVDNSKGGMKRLETRSFVPRDLNDRRLHERALPLIFVLQKAPHSPSPHISPFIA